MNIGKKIVNILSNGLLLIFYIINFLMDNIFFFVSKLWVIVIKLKYLIKIKIVETIY